MKRYELKFYITTDEAEHLIGRVQKILHSDINNPVNSRYLIRSLYFESHDRASLWEKLGGFNKREKIRLRFYNPPFHKGDKLKLEIKRKEGDLVDKDACLITYDEALQVMGGSVNFLYEKYDDNKAAKDIFLAFRTKHYRPFVIVSYFRRAFEYDLNRLRITLDFNISSSQNIKNLFNGHLSGDFTILPRNLVVLEVKFYNFFPSHLSFLFSGITKVRSAVSKFVMCSMGTDIPSLAPIEYGVIRQEFL